MLPYSLIAVKLELQLIRRWTKNQTTECIMKLIDELASQARKEWANELIFAIDKGWMNDWLISSILVWLISASRLNWLICWNCLIYEFQKSAIKQSINLGRNNQCCLLNSGYSIAGSTNSLINEFTEFDWRHSVNSFH